MIRFPAHRTLATALLGTLISVAGIAPAFAQQQQDGDGDKNDRRAARKEQRDAQGAQRPVSGDPSRNGSGRADLSPRVQTHARALDTKTPVAGLLTISSVEVVK